MRFLLYNLRYCAGTGRGFHFPFPGRGYLRRSTDHLQRVIRFIKAQQPDIVGLLEVDSGSYRSRRRNQAEEIAEALGHYHASHIKYGRRSAARIVPVLNKQANAFLTRARIRTAHVHYFARGMKRMMIELDLDNLAIFLVHLSLGYRARQSQLRALAETLRYIRRPCIVAGDFNILRGPEELQELLARARLRSADQNDRHSHPSWAPKRQLDFILHNDRVRVTNFRVPRVTLSDHLPLICDFEVC